MKVEIVLTNVLDTDIAQTAKELSDAGLQVSFVPSAEESEATGRRGPSDYSLWLNLAGVGLSAISLVVTVITALRKQRPECNITLKIPGESEETAVNIQPHELEEILNRLIANSRQPQNLSE